MEVDACDCGGKMNQVIMFLINIKINQRLIFFDLFSIFFNKVYKTYDFIYLSITNTDNDVQDPHSRYLIYK